MLRLEHFMQLFMRTSVMSNKPREKYKACTWYCKALRVVFCLFDIMPGVFFLPPAETPQSTISGSLEVI